MALRLNQTQTGARAAHTVSALGPEPIGVGLVERVPALAVGLARVLGSGTHPAQDVHSHCHLLNVNGIDARPVATQVVESQRLVKGTCGLSIRPSVGLPRSAFGPELPVSHPVTAGEPRPAGTGPSRLVNLGPESSIGASEIIRGAVPVLSPVVNLTQAKRQDRAVASLNRARLSRLPARWRALDRSRLDQTEMVHRAKSVAILPGLVAALDSAWGSHALSLPLYKGAVA